MKKRNRVLAFVMALVMTLSLLPTSVFADGEEPTAHKHSDECYFISERLICELEEGEEHEHTEDCYEQSRELVCGLTDDGEEPADGDLPEEDPDLPLVPLMAPLLGTPGDMGVRFVPAYPHNEYDVQINGEGPIITIYCLQQKNLWPGADVVYYDKDGASSEFEYKNLLSDEEVQIIRKLVYAGYPNDSQGILRRYWLEGELGGAFTNQAIWFLMSEWEKPGSSSTKLDYDNIPEDDLASLVAAELIKYAKTAPDIVLPAADDINVEGDFTLNEMPGGKYSTGYLQITRPTGLNLLFSLGLPAGVTAVDEYGFEVTEIGEYENFRLVADKREDIEGGALFTSAVLKYPGDVTFYVTNQDTGRYNQVDHTKQLYQTMLFVPEHSMTLSRSFDLAAGAQATVEIKGQKIWDDNDDQDGKRPDSIVIDLHENGVKIDSKTVTPDTDGNWTWEWTGLPKYKDGSEVVYDVFEEAIEDYTSTKIDHYSFINHYTPGETSVYVEKIWDDNDNQDGKRPDYVIVQLLADGVEVAGKTLTITVDEDGKWEGEFADLPEYEGGKLIEYSVKEIAVPGYTTTVDGSQTEGFTITNSYSPKTVSVSGQKIWDDKDNQDGKRPGSIQIHLHADGKHVDDAVVTEADGWAWSFTDLPKYDGGTEIVYTVKEDEVEDYTTTYSRDNYDITNQYTPGQTSVSVSKVWNDEHDRDGIRPANVTVRLYADGVYTGQSLILNEENSWSGSFGPIDEYKDGKKITYTVLEASVDGYVAHVSGSADMGYTITNTHTPKVIKVSGSKTWDDDNDAAGNRPDSITIRLRADGTEIKTATVKASDGWKWSFEDLPKYENGTEIVYSVTEDAVPDYSTDYDGFDVTNHYTPSKTSITVGKRWQDNGDQDGLRPESITVKLLANGIDTGLALILDESSHWEGTFSDLNVKAGGAAIVYTVEEIEIAGYTGVVSGSAKTGFVITNTHASEAISVSGFKTWNDADNQDGKRPSSITVRLHANGVEKAHKVVSAAEGWAWEWTDLPKYEGGKEISYTITEDAVDEYSTAYEDYNVINTYAPGKVSLSVSKAWHDQGNQDGKRPDHIVITLVKDGTDTTTTLVLNEMNGWTGTFLDLDEYAGGTKIVYTVKESEVEGYTSVMTGDAHIGFTFTNSYTPETVNVIGSKTWDDKDDQDGKRPASITVRLHADGVEVDHKTANSANNWKWIFTGLPKYKDGTLINYTVTEDGIDDYSTSYDGYNITNKYTPGKTSVTVEKRWQDDDDRDGIRPAMIVVKLFADGVDTGKKLVLDDGNNWEAAFGELDEYKSGSRIIYTVEEESTAAGYSSAVSGSASHGFTIINTHETETISISGSKTWKDADDQDGKRPASITIRLHANGAEQAHKVVSAADGWAWKWTDLPKYEGGKEIIYTITEDAVDEYSTEYKDFDVINTYTPGKVSISVSKVWDDKDNQDGKRPEDITVTLFADGVETSTTAVLSEANHWMASFHDLEEYAGGKRIAYTVKESEVSGYTSVLSGSEHIGYTFTNSYTPETTNVVGTKTWDDKNNQDGKRPDTITVRLHADGMEVDHKIVSSVSEWKWSFEDLPKYKDGAIIHYTITEDSVDEYSTHYDGYSITNKYTPGKTSVSVEKVWNDNHDQDGIRPASVTIKLYADGVDTGKSLVLNDANNWMGVFDELDEYKGGSVIAYTVAEDPAVTGYATVVDGSAGHGFTVINTHAPETMTLSGSKTWNDKDDQDSKRPASITVRLLADNVEVAHKVVTAADGWKWSFEDLPKFKAGSAIDYTIVEDSVEDYSAVYSGMDIINSYTPDVVSVAVSKIWHDGSDQDGIRPDSVTIRLYADGVFTGETVVLNKANHWSGSFDGLDEYKGGAKIVYSVSEDAVSGYTTSIVRNSDYRFTVTNSYVPATVSVSVSKVWDDNRNAYGLRPASIVIHLLADGWKVDSAVVTAADGWKWTFTDLPAYEGGLPVVYTVTEDSVPGYVTAITGTAALGFTVTNKVQPGGIGGPGETGSLVVSKTVEGNAASTTREFDFTVKLSDTDINGTYGEMTFVNGVATFKLKHNESRTASDLPAGIGYTVTESNNTGYKVSKTGDTGIIAAGKTAYAQFVNSRNEGDVPKTGDSSRLLVWILLVAAAAAVLVVTLLTGKHRKNEGKRIR